MFCALSPRTCLILLAGLLVATGPAFADTKVWQGDDATTPTLWNTPANWDVGTIAGASDIAVFGSGAATTSVVVNGGNKQTAELIIEAGAPTFTFSGGNYLAPTIVTVQAGVTTNQNFNGLTRSFGTITFNHHGSGALIIANLLDDGGGTSVSTALLGGAGSGSFTNVTSATRAMRLTQSAGTWAVTDVFDFRIQGAATTNSLITVNGGSFNLSSMVLNLEYAVAPSLASYTLIDYSGGAGSVTVNSGSGVFFESVTANGVAGLPSGYTVVHDTIGKTINLVAVPEPSNGLLVTGGLLIAGNSIRRRRVC